MARTNIVLDDELVARAQELTGARTKREAVDIALRRLVDFTSAYRALRKLHKHAPWDGDIDGWRKGRH